MLTREFCKQNDSVKFNIDVLTARSYDVLLRYFILMEILKINYLSVKSQLEIVYNLCV